MQHMVQVVQECDSRPTQNNDSGMPGSSVFPFAMGNKVDSRDQVVECIGYNMSWLQSLQLLSSMLCEGESDGPVADRTTFKLLVGRTKARQEPKKEEIESELYEQELEPYYVDGPGSAKVTQLSAISLVNSVCLASIENRCVLQLSTKEEVGAVHYEWACKIPCSGILRLPEEVSVPEVNSIQMVLRWCQQFQDGPMIVLDDARPGHLIVDHIITEAVICHVPAHKIIHYIVQYCSVIIWLPHQLTPDPKLQRMEISLQHLLFYEVEGNVFLFQIVTGDESWIHDLTCESKAASVAWKPTTSSI
ncbi:hypothetical protein PR048_015067 [Dryococelus australis]|uniref:Uncharacterized protein n=1 Tax=Dryococelus australis TaxID=614101 RepID=A0ABQ9HFZ4_9NEOP|nr:hypothetical protein PR048_015067 [Dryococelus australis]